MTTKTEVERPRGASSLDPARPVDVIVYHHTHWDREWWTTRRDFSVRLADLLDRLLDLLDTDPEFTTFVLDGQMVMLEDYLELRPDQRERFVARIREGRIHVGPWYVLADTLIPSGEAAVRNLWLGRRVARWLDVPTMAVGYLPDQFGHAAQLPQILRGFGVHDAVVWRGFGAPPPGQGTDPNAADLVGPPPDDVPYYPRIHGRGRHPEEMQTEFWWEAPDGSRVLGVYLAHEYYVSHAPRAVLDDRAAWDAWLQTERSLVDYLRPYASGNRVLHPYGGDHLPVDPRLPELLRRLNAEHASDGLRFRHGSLREYLDAVRTDEDRVSIVWHGEGRAFGRKAHLLPGVTSTRLYLKRLNRDAQVALERHAEPLQALSWMLGGPYEASALWAAWRLVVQNQPHDSITGCSIDAVHRQNVARYEEAIDLARFLALRAAQRIAAHVRPASDDQEGEFVVFNPLGFARTDAARMLVDPTLEVSPARWQLEDADGAPVPFQTQRVDERRTALPSRDWTEVAFVAADVPALGIRRYRLRRRTDAPRRRSALDHTVLGVVARDKGAERAGDLAIGPGRLENEFLRVDVDPRDGSLTVEDRATGERYDGLNVLEDGGDAGDEYNYSWPVGDVTYSTRDVRPTLRWLEVGPARATLRVTWSWRLPESLTEDRRSRSATFVPFELHSDVTLHAGVRRVDVRTHGANTARDHRLRVLLPLGRAADRSNAESAFAVIDRPVAVDEVERGSAEPAVPEFPQQSFTSVAADGRGLTVANRGLSEAAVLDDDRGTVALTLIRSVGYLSRGDLLTRIEGAGPLLPTPEAQMLGPFVAEYSIIPHAGAWSDAASHRDAHAFNAELLAVELPGWRLPGDPWARDVEPSDRVLDPIGSLLDIDGGVEISAVKRAEDRDELVVRVVNLSEERRPVRIRPLRPATRAARLNLAEDPSDELGVTDGVIELHAGPWELVTVGIGFDA